MIEPLTVVKPPRAERPPLGQALEEIARTLEGIGLDRKVLAEEEKRDTVSYWKDWPAARINGLTPAKLQELAAACYGAVELKLEAGPAVVKLGPGLSPPPSQEELDDLLKYARILRKVTVGLTLNKATLLGSLGLRGEHAVAYLYLYPEAALNAIDRIYACGEGTGELLEAAGKKTVILVRERDVFLDGPWLAVVGGKFLPRWQSVLPERLPAAGLPAALIQRVTGPQSPLGWMGFSYGHLTPHHLDLSWADPGRPAPAGDPLVVSLGVQRLALALIFTADLTRSGSDGWTCTFRSDNQTAVVPLPAAGASCAGFDLAAVETLARRALWTYGDKDASPSPTTASVVPDRLRIFRGVVARRLAGDSRGDNFSKLLAGARDIEGDTEGTWASFIGGLLTEFFGRVQQLERMVSDAVQSLQAQTQALGKGLTDGVLASVAAAVAVFLGALFSKETAVFRIGMMIYAAYFALIPGAMGLTTLWQQFDRARKLFDSRVKEFRRHLPPETVDRLIAENGGIDSPEKYFRWWFALAVIVYSLVFAALLASAWLAPSALLQPRG
jgi:hypothetical protein